MRSKSREESCFGNSRCIQTCLFLTAISLTANSLPSGALHAQTPWQTAPALPAQLPAERPNNVSSLPAPPSKSLIPDDIGTRTSIATPPQVSIPGPQAPASNRYSGSSQPGGSAAGSTLPGGKPLSSSQPGAQIPLPSPGLGTQSNQAAIAPPAGQLPARKTQLSFPALPGVDTTKSGIAPPVTQLLPGGPRANANVASYALDGAQTKQVSTPRVSSSVASDDGAIRDGTLVAVVGTEHILAGDLSGFVEPAVEKYRDRITSKSDEEKLREQVIRAVLKNYVEIKAMYLEFFRDAAGTATPDKLDEMREQVLSKAGKLFFSHQVPVLQKNHDVGNLQDLEKKLREKSMSLQSMKASFVEQVLANELENKYVPRDFEVSRNELLEYYKSHASDWQEKAKVRWEQLTIRFDKHDGNRTEVEKRIIELGNRVYLGGQAFESVAKQASEGWTADQGGRYDWTHQGSLKSTALDQALFTLELDRLSKVIEDDIGMHIIRVLEREEAHTTPFTEAQAEIREILSKEKREDAAKKLRASVLERTPIWTLWPEDLEDKAKLVRPLREATHNDQG